ncbi:MAG TPA: hypothetical protein VIV11_32205 [Kofleriaceae bacterium]
MRTDPLVQAFETATIDPSKFRHREHLYVAWCYLRDWPLEDALARYVRHLRQLTHALGVPQKFHTTMTWAYVALLHDAMERTPSVGFDELLAANPGLLDHRGALDVYYDRDQLQSEEARRRFVLPRRR